MNITCKYRYQQQKLQLYSVVLLSCVIWNVDTLNVVIKSPQRVLIGSYANFTATLYDDDGVVANTNDYRYTWRDNANPPHYMEAISKQPYSSWFVRYPYEESIIGMYEVTVQVEKQMFFYINIASGKVSINVTNKLDGDLVLMQGNVLRPGQYVSTKHIVNHTIALPLEEYNYLKENDTYIQTYWYQNCTYLGVSNGLSYEAAYNQSNATYFIEALAVVFFKKPSVTITTTTATPTTTDISTINTTSTTAIPLISSTETSTTTTVMRKSTAPTLDNLNNSTNNHVINISANSSSTVMPNITLEYVAAAKAKDVHKKIKRDVIYSTTTATTMITPTSISTSTIKNGIITMATSKKAEIIERDTEKTVTNKTKSSLDTQNSINVSSVVVNPNLHPGFITAQQQELINSVSSRLTIPPPFNCATKQLLTSSNVTKPAYIGYYTRLITPKDPISNFTFSKQTWLKQGDILYMNVKCDGSPIIEYCTLVFNAPYNATGEENCPYYAKLTECKFNYTRYFSESKTVLFFIRNQVSKVVNQVTINIYEVKKQSQLSVVVVPVSFTLIAIILVVFGVYYYVQKRTRFNVEVADFNFGETQSVDMEYKTFHARLYESICEALPQRWRYRTTNDSESSDNGDNADRIITNNATSSTIQYNTLN